MLLIIWLVILGFSSGIAVGTGFIALLTLLKIIPRLIQLSGNRSKTKLFISPIIFGSLFGSYLSFTNQHFHLPTLFLILFGAFQGIFVGMLAASLAEVLNVFPILSRRVRLEKDIKTLMMALVFGKVFGSLFHWLFFAKL